MLHAGNCLLGELLVGPQCCSSPSLSGCHYPAHNVNANSLYKQLPAARRLHQSHWCMDRGKFFGHFVYILAFFCTFWEGLPDFWYFASLNNSLPPVAYTKAIDVWTGGNCFGPFGYILKIFGTFWEWLPDFLYFSSINNSLPHVAYTKAIDMWTRVSFFGHFGTF